MEVVLGIPMIRIKNRYERPISSPLCKCWYELDRIICITCPDNMALTAHMTTMNVFIRGRG